VDLKRQMAQPADDGIAAGDGDERPRRRGRRRGGYRGTGRGKRIPKPERP